MEQPAALALLDDLFNNLATRDVPALLGLFADEAVLFDPHYPEMEMSGRAAIERGIAWGMGSMEQFGFTVKQGFASDDGAKAIVEVDTHHVLKGGKALNFPQVFVVETEGGLITALRAYEPYRPDGLTGFFVRVSHLQERITHRLKSRR